MSFVARFWVGYKSLIKRIVNYIAAVPRLHYVYVVLHLPNFFTVAGDMQYCFSYGIFRRYGKNKEKNYL